MMFDQHLVHRLSPAKSELGLIQQQNSIHSPYLNVSEYRMMEHLLLGGIYSRKAFIIRFMICRNVIIPHLSFQYGKGENSCTAESFSNVCKWVNIGLMIESEQKWPSCTDMSANITLLMFPMVSGYIDCRTNAKHLTQAKRNYFALNWEFILYI